MPEVVSRQPFAVESQLQSRPIHWDFWWTKLHWCSLFSKYFGFTLSASLHECFILTLMYQQLFKILAIDSVFKSHT